MGWWRMADVTFKWYDKDVQAKVKRELLKRLPGAGEMLRSQIVRNVSAGFTRSEGPSAPGEFPHKDTGRLASSFFSEVQSDRMVCVVGSPLKYAFYLETGTEHMEARPHIRRTFLEIEGRLAAYLTRSIGGSSGTFTEID
jgi:hypothetical protein